MAATAKYIGGGTGTLALDDAVFGERDEPARARPVPY